MNAHHVMHAAHGPLNRLALALLATFPVNGWLISRGHGHALVHAFHAPAAAPPHSEHHHEHA